MFRRVGVAGADVSCLELLELLLCAELVGLEGEKRAVRVEKRRGRRGRGRDTIFKESGWRWWLSWRNTSRFGETSMKSRHVIMILSRDWLADSNHDLEKSPRSIRSVRSVYTQKRNCYTHFYP